jgi:hypothetical protein
VSHPALSLDVLTDRVAGARGPSLDWSDPVAVCRWLAGLRLAFNDADAVTLDMLRPPRHRELGPAVHAKNYENARAAILAALPYAATPEPEPEEDDGGPGPMN